MSVMKIRLLVSLLFSSQTFRAELKEIRVGGSQLSLSSAPSLVATGSMSSAPMSPYDSSEVLDRYIDAV
jgi:hypothetical protein